MNYTDEQIQNAIDEAIEATSKFPFMAADSAFAPNSWDSEAPERLAIARAFLAALSKPTTPWTLPTPPTGHRWHREDWTQGMLPDGYRPLLKDEPWLHGDEILRYNEWQVAGQHEDDAIGSPTTKYKCHCRTRRSLPAQVNAKPMESWANADNAKAFEQFQAEIEAVWEGKPIDGPQAAQYYMPKLPNPLAPLWTPKPGDVVRLKSGGPKMAVDTVAEPDEHREGQLVYGCFWIAKDGRPQAFKLPAVLLQPAD
jgi:uncharacterized protein YodC (DUF2158 family)